MAAGNPSSRPTAFVFRGFSLKKKSAGAMPLSESRMPWASNLAAAAKGVLEDSIAGSFFLVNQPICTKSGKERSNPWSNQKRGKKQLSS